MKLSSWTTWGPQRRRKPATPPVLADVPPSGPEPVHVDFSAVHTPPTPTRQPAIHLRYPSTTHLDTTPTAACGKYAAAAYVTSEPAEVTCGGCKRTGQYRNTTGS